MAVGSNAENSDVVERASGVYPERPHGRRRHIRTGKTDSHGNEWTPCNLRPPKPHSGRSRCDQLSGALRSGPDRFKELRAIRARMDQQISGRELAVRQAAMVSVNKYGSSRPWGFSLMPLERGVLRHYDSAGGQNIYRGLSKKANELRMNSEIKFSPGNSDAMPKKVMRRVDRCLETTSFR
jgi:hypothetical protein